jgi:hypothetical protein
LEMPMIMNHNMNNYLDVKKIIHFQIPRNFYAS